MKKSGFMPNLAIGIGLSFTLFLSACQDQNRAYDETETNKTGSYAVLGALAGATAGLVAGDNSDESGAYALLGAGGGAIIGAAIGQYFDSQEQALQKDLNDDGIEIVRSDETTINIKLPGDITFASNSANVSPRFYRVLDQVVETLISYPKTRVTIIGHTDNLGSYSYNRHLSETRARAVASYLMRRGVSNYRIVTSGQSYAQPVADNRTDYGRALNRRVDMVLTPLESY